MESYSKYFCFGSFSWRKMEGLLVGNGPRAGLVPPALTAWRKSWRSADLKLVISKGGRKGNVPLRCICSDDETPEEALRLLLSEDYIGNCKEVVEWESGKSLDTILKNQGIRIRRRPPNGPSVHPVGPFEFRIEMEGNTPRNILEKIIWDKELEVATAKAEKSLGMVTKDVISAPPVRDFLQSLKASAKRTGMPALIAEVKKASPSGGVFREDFDPVQIAHTYEKNGAACLSILADEKYFQGSFANLNAVRKARVKCPLLCKEFIIDVWQIYYARSQGADAILLIAAVLPNVDIKYMSKICRKLGMAVLVEVHNEREIDRVLSIEGIQLIGINNRDLETFVVDISNTKKLLEGERGQIIRQKGITVVSESGLYTPEDIAFVQNAGANAVLVGESLIRQDDPGKGIAQLFGKDISPPPWKDPGIYYF